MTSRLQRAALLDELASHLYDFLPWKPHPYGDQSLSFGAAANEVGLGSYWSEGSKQPALRRMLEGVMDSGTGKFSQLISRIVERSITYRKRKDPHTRENFVTLNAILEKLGYRIPELIDHRFLASFPLAGHQGDHVGFVPPARRATAELQARLMQISAEAPQRRGFSFEPFLSELFASFQLAPRGAFRLQGEQIDGSFEVQQTTYLLEAKWQNAPIGQADLLAFAGKVSGKAAWTRGLFVSYSGFSADGLQAFSRGKQTSIVCVDGLDLAHILNGGLDLVEVIARKARHASETNNAFISVRQLFPNVI